MRFWRKVTKKLKLEQNGTRCKIRVSLIRGQPAIPKILQRINDILPPEGKKSTALGDVRPSRGKKKYRSGGCSSLQRDSVDEPLEDVRDSRLAACVAAFATVSRKPDAESRRVFELLNLEFQGVSFDPAGQLS